MEYKIEILLIISINNLHVGISQYCLLCSVRLDCQHFDCNVFESSFKLFVHLFSLKKQTKIKKEKKRLYVLECLIIVLLNKICVLRS